MEVKLQLFQDKFLFSKKRYPAMVAGIGTGKTMMMLLKVFQYCETYPDSLALVIRKEYTDLRDSTLKDFETYFGTGVNTDKEYKFQNGSIIMFRHGAELNVLKNINLSVFAIEQAEEFETDEVFTFCRDRLRRANGDYRQGLIIANANGHNWIWKLWKNNPTEEFELQEATTFNNECNLPRDFIADLKRMEVESPNHYRRYVMNSHEDMEADDTLFTYESLKKSIELSFDYKGGKAVLSSDIARYGESETVFTMIESRGVLRWEQTFLEHWKGKNLMQSVGKIADLKRTFRPTLVTVDDDGLGGGVTDRLEELKNEIIAFHGGAKARDEDRYVNAITEAYFLLKDLIDKKYFKIFNDSEMIDQLLSRKFRYNSKGQKCLITKEQMRKEGLKSPDRADALVMAVYQANEAFAPDVQERNQGLPRYAIHSDAEAPQQIETLPRYAVTE